VHHVGLEGLKLTVFDLGPDKTNRFSQALTRHKLLLPPGPG